MANELTIGGGNSIEPMLRQFSSLSTEQLRAELAEGLKATAESLLRLSAIVRVLEERGEDLSKLRVGLIGYLRRIAYGQMDPGVVVRFAEYPALLQRVGRLPMPEQVRLASGDPVSVATKTDDGIVAKKIDPLMLSSDQIRTVFGDDRIRPVAEQELFVENGRPPKNKKPIRRYKVKVDKATKDLVIGRARVSIGEVLRALSDAGGWSGEIDDDARLNNEMPRAATNLTPAEKERLVALAKALRLSEWEIVRRAVLTWLI